MSSWQRALICLSVLLALALLGPASALAGGSAGDQQYIDPLGGQNPNPSSHHSGPSSGSTNPSAPAASSAGSSTGSSTSTGSQSFASTSSSTGATAAGSSASSPTGSSSSSTGADPGGKTLPLTGFDAWAGAFVGLGLLGTGLAVRRAARRAE